MSELNHNPKPQTELQGNTSPPSFSMSPFCLREVIDTLWTIDTRKSTGADNLAALFLKLSVPLIAECITYIFSLTIFTGIIPTAWKTAYVLPLHKGGDKTDITKIIIALSPNCVAWLKF